MARGKAISVKVSRLKVIKALEGALAKLEKNYSTSKKAEENFEKAQQKWRVDVAKIAVDNIKKAENLRVNSRWNGVINVDFDIPKNTAVKLPTEPERDKNVEMIHDHQYKEQKQELENAIRILGMSDEEVVNTSTYQAVAQYL